MASLTFTFSSFLAASNCSLRDFLDGDISKVKERRKHAVKKAETRAQAKKAGMSAKQFEAAKKDESVNVKLATLKNLIKKGR